jgi:thiamine-monophosphate kinase
MTAGETLDAIGEAGLLERLGPMLRRHTAGLPLGTGDDVAITPAAAMGPLVWTIDSMIEGTHFRWWRHIAATPAALGWKLTMTNLSDLASKGARPLFALISLGIPAHADAVAVEGVYTGIDEALAAGGGARLLGGDTVAAPCWMLTMAVVGELPAGAAVAARARARPGQYVYTTGPLGGSAAGLAVLESRVAAMPAAAADVLVVRHLRPVARLAAGAALAVACPDLAMMDISDGLVHDAGIIAHQSGAAIVLDAEALAPDDDLAALARAAGRDPMAWILNGGEDYELLVATAMPPDAVAAIAPGTRPIGRVEPGPPGVWIVAADGTRTPLGFHGFEHFQQNEGA